ncbi:Rap/ran-GAP protein, partial [Teladorsagia circumcincta]
LSRKRHIGNDMVTVVFQEPGALPFSPIAVRSHFQHVFIIVRVHNACTDNVSYSVAVSRSKEVPAFGPPLPKGATFSKCADFHDWLLTKIINAENAVHRSKKFATMAARTRREALRDLAENYRVSCVLGLSQDALVLLERPSGVAIFSTPTHSIIGWANTDMGLKIYYDHGDMLLLRCCTETGTDAELNLLLQRLKAVTKGDEAKEVVLRRARTSDSWGFHVQDEGVVTDVEMYQTAWKASLRQGSRIVEIESLTVATLSFDKISEILSQRDAVRLLLISPANDGSPRRGCEDPHCPAVKGAEQMLTPDAFARQPVSYQEMFRMRNREYGTSPANSPAGSLEARSFTFSNMKRADGARANSTCTASSYGQGTTLTSINRQTSSVHDHMCLMLNAPKALIRAQSDEHLRSPTIAEENKKAPLSARVSSNEQDAAELARCQQNLERAYQEKRALEMLVQQLRKQLMHVVSASEIYATYSRMFTRN